MNAVKKFLRYKSGGGGGGGGGGGVLWLVGVRVRLAIELGFGSWGGGAFLGGDFFLEPQRRIQNPQKHTTELSAKTLKSINYFRKKLHLRYFIFLFLKFLYFENLVLFSIRCHCKKLYTTGRI